MPAVDDAGKTAFPVCFALCIVLMTQDTSIESESVHVMKIK